MTSSIAFAALLPAGCSPHTAAGRAPLTRDLKNRAMQIVEQSLADPDPQLRANAIEVVARTGRIALMPNVQQLLHDDFVPVRFAAAVAAGDMRYSPAATDVAELLRDGDENVRIAAAYASYKLGTDTGLELVRRAVRSNDLRVRANAAFLLGKSGDRNSLDLLYEAMRDDSSNDMVRLNAVEAIARLGDENIYNKIWTMLISAYADVRLLGVRAMGALGTARARDALLTMLDDDLPEVRLVAAEQLGALGDTSGEAVVLQALSKAGAGSGDADSRERVSMLAALAAGRIRTERLSPYLAGLLGSPSKTVRIAAAEAVIEYVDADNIGL